VRRRGLSSAPARVAHAEKAPRRPERLLSAALASLPLALALAIPIGIVAGALTAAHAAAPALTLALSTAHVAGTTTGALRIITMLLSAT